MKDHPKRVMKLVSPEGIPQYVALDDINKGDILIIDNTVYLDEERSCGLCNNTGQVSVLSSFEKQPCPNCHKEKE